MATKKKAVSKSSAMSQSAKSHQKSLAKISGGTAARKASKKGANFDMMAIKGSNAENKTRKSFGLKSRSSRSEY